MVKNNDISCVFNSDVTLMISQKSTGNVLIETDDTIDGTEAFEDPFIIFHPNNDAQHQHLFPFFESLLNQTDDCDLTTMQSPPDIKTCISGNLTQTIGHGCYSKLSLHFSNCGLVGIRAGAHVDFVNPTVWINPQQDCITKAAKPHTLSLSKN